MVWLNFLEKDKREKRDFQLWKSRANKYRMTQLVFFAVKMGVEGCTYIATRWHCYSPKLLKG